MTDEWTTTMRRRYVCRRVATPLDLGGDASDPGWDALPWSEPFVDITGTASLAPRFRTRMRMGWDDRFLYVNADMEEPHVWGTITEKNAVMFEDNDFEIFIDPDCDGLNYYEFEINALGSIWELCLPKPYGAGGVPRLGCNIDGLVSRVRVAGTLNDPTDIDEGWSVRGRDTVVEGSPSTIGRAVARHSRAIDGASISPGCSGATRSSMGGMCESRRTARRLPRVSIRRNRNTRKTTGSGARRVRSTCTCPNAGASWFSPDSRPQLLAARRHS